VTDTRPPQPSDQARDSVAAPSPAPYLATLVALLWLVGRDLPGGPAGDGIFLFSGACLVALPVLALDGLSLALRRVDGLLRPRAWHRIAGAALFGLPVLYTSFHVLPGRFDHLHAVPLIIAVGAVAAWFVLPRIAPCLGLPEDDSFRVSVALAATVLAGLLFATHAAESTFSHVTPGTEPLRMALFLGTFGLSAALVIPWAQRFRARHGRGGGGRAQAAWSGVALLVGLVLVEVDRRELRDLYPALHAWLGFAGAVSIDAAISPWLGRRRGRGWRFAGASAIGFIVVGAALFWFSSGRATEPAFRARVGRLAIGSALLDLHPAKTATSGTARDHPALHYPQYLDYPAPEPGLNLMIISVDALRADHVQGPGDPVTTMATPQLQGLASESVYFRRAWAPGTRTAIGMGCLWVGRYSANVEWVFWASGKGPDGKRFLHERNKLSPKQLARLGGRFGHTTFPRWERWGTLIERISARGYRTLANPYGGKRGRWFQAGVGFDRGFDVYRDYKKGLKVPTSSVVADHAIEQLEGRGEGRWLQWVHLYDPHQEWKSLKRYRRMVRATDDAVGKLLDNLKAKGLWDRTVVAVVADHGQAFREHGQSAHANSLYEEQVRVPMMLRIPGVEPRVVEEPASTLDLTATLLALAGADMADQDGVNLLPLAYEGRYPEGRPVFSELHRFRGKKAKVSKDLKAVTRGRWKLIHDRRRGTVQLFDLVADPGEKRSRLEEEAAVAKELKAILDAFVARGEVVYPLPRIH
jgi:hypothetical protein